MASERTALKALLNLISEAELVIAAAELPQSRGTRALELLRSALALTDDLIGQTKLAQAALMGRKGGAGIAKRGPEYVRRYNFWRVRRSLRATPAMEAGITDRVWGLKDLLA